MRLFSFFVWFIVGGVVLVLGVLAWMGDGLNRDRDRAVFLSGEVIRVVADVRGRFSSYRDYSGLGGGYRREGNDWGEFFVGVLDEGRGFHVRLTGLPFFVCGYLLGRLSLGEVYVMEAGGGISLSSLSGWLPVSLGGERVCGGGDGGRLRYAMDLWFR